MKTSILYGALAFALAAIPIAGHAAPPPAARPNSKLMAAVQACDPYARKLLERLVAIDSGTGDAEGLNAVGAIYASEFKDLGADVHTVPPPGAPKAGDDVVATVMGTGKGRVLMVAHMDTVFNRGDVAKIGPHWEGEHYVGPGSGDDKVGGVTALCALRALKAVNYRDFARIDVLLNSNEETGSVGSRDLIRAMARNADAAINLERGTPGDRVNGSRKGSAILTFDATGRAAHSGLEPEKGRNAALEMARLAVEVSKLGNPDKGTTVVVTILNGGGKLNVVPDHASLTADVRAYSAEEFDRVQAGAADLAAHPSIMDVTVKTNLQRNFPPWPKSDATAALLGRANRLYAELGRKLTPQDVGSSADVAFAAETGTPSIDGFGIEGDGAHSPTDFADFATFAPRTYLLARMLMDLGRDPPHH